MQSFEDEMTYFENMSRAFAMKAHNIATVLHRELDNPPTNGIWGRIELPVLQAAGNPGGMVDYVRTILILRCYARELTGTCRLLPSMRRIPAVG
jgi:hypothetical protein